jgi:hypothetical protein
MSVRLLAQKDRYIKDFMNHEKKEAIVSNLKNIQSQNIQAYLKSLDLSIVEAILVTRHYYKISLQQAKEMVANDKVWEKEAAAGDKLHEIVLEEINRDND